MSSADESKNVFRPRTAEVYLLITEGLKSICVRVELITCKIEKQERRNWGPSNLCINTPPHHHLSCCSVANSLQVTFASRGEQRCLLVLLLLLVAILKFTAQQLCWNEPLGFFCVSSSVAQKTAMYTVVSENELTGLFPMILPTPQKTLHRLLTATRGIRGSQRKRSRVQPAGPGGEQH